jgi:NADPH-dependent 2,4-dienoyl-CoA reductase/sulfur reductase-like enzyme
MVMGDLVREVDVAVIGGGPGGYSAAFRCAELGMEVVVVDAGARLGGACLFEGCIPSKALLHVAALLDDAERAKELGVDFGPPRVSLDPLRKWKNERVIGRLARGLASVAKAKGVDVVGGRAVFEDARGLRVEGDAPQKIVFHHAVIATGSTPSRPAGLALESERVMDSTAALEIADIPERLLVIGGGYIGLEMGTVYAQLGSKVSVVELLDEIFIDPSYELLVLGGQHDKLSRLEAHLPKRLRNRLAGTFTVDARRDLDAEVRDRAGAIVDGWEREDEKRKVHDLFERASTQRPTAIGLRECLWAATTGAVEELLVHDEVTAPGVVCPQDGWLGESGDACPISGTKTRQTPDVIDELTERVVDDGGTVKHVMVETELAPHRVAAVLRFPLPASP